ncbi:MAG: GNAT family N-acetyltransferase [Bauldia sp.]|nr:GNAT family N-acetyltransferase [Bauldia sp.]
MAHILDRPVWSALTGRHAGFAEGGALARRYQPSVIPFAAARDASDESLRALAALPRPGEEMMIVEADRIVLPRGLSVLVAAHVAQIVLVTPPAKAPDHCVERLTEADAPEMLALAQLTHPGPFTLGAQALGAFHGIRIDGHIAAMAGVRMRQEGHVEISGVCTHPDFQGRGLARRLSVFMTRRVLDEGDTPYLHTFSTNAAAIGLYRSIGYEVRTTLNVVMVRAEEHAAAA